MHLSAKLFASFFPLDALQLVVVVTLFYRSLDWTKISGAMQHIIRDGVSLLVSDSDKQLIFVQKLRFILCTSRGSVANMDSNKR